MLPVPIPVAPVVPVGAGAKAPLARTVPIAPVCSGVFPIPVAVGGGEHRARVASGGRTAQATAGTNGCAAGNNDLRLGGRDFIE